MSKIEFIKKVWGELYNKFESFLDDNGKLDSIFLYPDEIEKWKNNEFPNICYIDGYFIPKELIGIHDNNGWIKIESENNLPKEMGYTIFVCHAIDGYFRKEYDNITTKEWWGGDENMKKDWLENITHYHPIEIKPKFIY